MKSFLSFVLLFLVAGTAFAQIEREEIPPPSLPQVRVNQLRIAGKVVDSASARPLEAVTVQLYVFPSNGGGRDSVAGGGFTRANGDFGFDVPEGIDSLRVVVSGVGYRIVELPLQTAALAGPVYDLGNIAIVPSARTLEQVVITTQQRPALQMGIDRKIFSVERNLTATGGTALDVMRNIPSVSVDVEGNVQLRNAQPQIFIDGRPTILTPDQIPADQIERIELITNPSAAFDAASSAGIINIIMKRNRRLGINGVATVGGGHPNIFNSNLSINARQGKVNLFASGGYNASGGRAKGRTLRENRRNGITQNYFNQYSLTESRRKFGSIRFGLDFFATNRTTISATQNIVDGRFTNDEQQDQEYLSSQKVLERRGLRLSEGENAFRRYNTQLNFTQRFAEARKELNASVTYNHGKGNDASNIVNAYYLPNGAPYSDAARVRNEGNNNSDQYTFQVDFVDPAGENGKLELGARSFINRQRSRFSSFGVDNGIETLLPLSNNYAYREMVNAAYVSYSNKVKNFSYMAGLRAEVSSFRGELIDSAKSFGYDYPNSGRRFFDALFPSLFLTQAIGEGAELQVNYTRRIRRPNFWQLNPFIDINDPVNLRQGNPLLQPEFVNSFELNYSQDYDKGNFLGVVYYRNNRRDITRYSDTISAVLYGQLNNAAIDPNAILNTFINARSTNRLGLELTLQHDLTKSINIVPTIDMQYQKVNAGFANLSNEGFNYEAELTLNYRFLQTAGFLSNLGLQLIGEYESAEVTPQGKNLAQYGADFGLRKEFLKDKKGAISFNINDIFNTQRFGSVFDTESFYQEAFRRRNVRSFRINFTYKFGKDNFNLFKREDREREEE